MACPKPFKLSMDVTNKSCIPRVCRFVNTDSQKRALSALSYTAHFEIVQRLKRPKGPDEGIHRLQRARPLLLDDRHDFVRDSRWLASANFSSRRGFTDASECPDKTARISMGYDGGIIFVIFLPAVNYGIHSMDQPLRPLDLSGCTILRWVV